MSSLTQLKKELEQLDPKGVLNGKAFELSFNESLGLKGSSDFVVGLPYTPWPVKGTEPPKKFESALAIGFKEVLDAGISAATIKDEKVFIDIAHLWGRWIEFFNDRNGTYGGVDNLAHYIGRKVKEVPDNATPVIRILVGGSETMSAAKAREILCGDVQKIFWPGNPSQCVFENPKTELHIGCYSPDFHLGLRAQTMNAATGDALDSLVDIIRKMVDNVLKTLWFVTWIPGINTKINKALSMLGKAEVIKFLANTTVPSISWNHAKILAVNGNTLMTGGVNFWKEYTDNEHHINDMSVKIRGDAAISAHSYCDYFWEYLNQADKTVDSQSFCATVRIAEKTGQPQWIETAMKIPLFGKKPTATSGKAVLTVNKLGDWTGPMKEIQYPIQIIDAVRDVLLNVIFRVIWKSNSYLIRPYFFPSVMPAVTDRKLLPSFSQAGVSPSAWASRITRCKAIASAKSSVHIDAATLACALHLDTNNTQGSLFVTKTLPSINEQLSLSASSGWDGVLWSYDLIEAVGIFLNQVDVSKNKTADKQESKWNGLFILLTSSKYTNKDDKGWADLVAIEEFKQRVRYCVSSWIWNFDSWWDERVTVKRIKDDGSMMNHCKVLCTDKKLMYVGSDNYYPSYNEEHGVWIDDGETINAWYDGFWNRRWEGATKANTAQRTDDFAATMV